MAHSAVVELTISVHRQIVRPSLEHDFGLAEWNAARPKSCSRVARSGQRFRSEVRADIQGVEVFPGDVALGLRHRKALADELPSLHIELAHDSSVGTPSRQTEQPPFVRWGQQAGATPHPAFTLCPVEPIEVEQHVPIGRRFLILG